MPTLHPLYRPRTVGHTARGLYASRCTGQSSAASRQQRAAASVAVCYRVLRGSVPCVEDRDAGCGQ